MKSSFAHTLRLFRLVATIALEAVVEGVAHFVPKNGEHVAAPLVALLSFGAAPLTDTSTCSETKQDAILEALAEVNASAKAGKDADDGRHNTPGRAAVCG